MLTWSNPTGTTQYHLQVIPASNDGPGVDLHVGSPDTSFQIPPPPQWYGLLPDMSYTWRMRVSDASAFVDLNDASWSSWAERTFRTPAVSSATISSVVSPPPQSSSAIFTPTLQWANSRTDVFYYEVQLSRDRTFTTDPATATAMVYGELRHGGATNPRDSYTVPTSFPLEASSTYFWRVRPRVQGDGTPLPWSTVWTFATPDSSNDLITGGGWECLPGVRVTDGKVFIPSSATNLMRLNDYALRLQTREDVTISITVEADTAVGMAGVTLWNTLPPPGDAARWYRMAARLVLGLNSGRPYLAVFDGVGAEAAFQYTGRPGGQTGPLALSVQRAGDSLVLRVADAEVARTNVLGPLTGGPLFFGPNVNPGKTLTIHRLAVTDGAHPDGAEIVRAVAPAAPAGTAPTLRTGAAARARLIGAAITRQTLHWNQQARDVAAREFNLLNAGDVFHWIPIRPARDQFRFCAEDQHVAFAEANNMRVLAGMLAWTHNPAWLMEGKFSRDDLIAILKEHIQTVVGRYRGRIHAWNVVNEPFNVTDGSLLKGEEQIWTRLIGPEYIDMAFRWAHEADPQAVLLLNEYDAEGFNGKSDAIYEFVKGMRARGVPIHGVGMQTHWGVRERFPKQRFDLNTIAPNMKRLADLGLEVYITEMDVPVLKPATPEQLATQAQTYRQMLEVCLAASNCKALSVFGVYDGDSAAQDLRFPTYDAPLLFDQAFRPKAAYDVLADVLRSK
ncbi:MAG: endo-1,4-beta-xylanase [Chloroflexota bacterium]